MKILRIAFENINALAGAWEIDLTQPEYRDGLFLISGETGAGKTSILDAVTLALFGRTARVRITNTSNEVMTRGQLQCWAEVDFDCPSGRYRAHWSHARRGRQNQNPFVPVRRRLSRYEDGAWVELPGTATELLQQTCAVVGTENFDQFLRTTILAQGQFDRFLAADGAESDRERANILEQVTGTEIYARIGSAIHARAASARQVSVRKQAERAGLGGQVLDEAARRALGDEMSMQLDLELQGRARIADLEDEVRVYAELAALEAECVDLAARQVQLEAEQARFAPTVARLERALAALRLRPKHEQLVQARLAVDRAEVERQACRVAFQSAEAVCAQRMQEKQVATERMSRAQEEQTAALPQIQEAERLEGEIAQSRSACERLEERRLEAAHTVEEMEIALAQDGQYVREQQVKAEACAVRAALEPSRLAELQQAVARAVEKQVEGAEMREEAVREESLRREDLVRSVAEAENDLLEARQVEGYAEARTHLVSGHPCPLCGAEEHPYCAHELPRADRLEARLAEAKARLADLDTRVHVAVRAAERADRAVQQAQNRYDAECRAWQMERDGLLQDEARHRAFAAERQRMVEERTGALADRRVRLEAAVRDASVGREDLERLQLARSACGVSGPPIERREQLEDGVRRATEMCQWARENLAAARQAAQDAAAALGRADMEAAEAIAAVQSRVEDFAACCRAADFADERTWCEACWDEQARDDAEKVRLGLLQSAAGLESSWADWRRRHDVAAACPMPRQDAEATAEALSAAKAACQQAHDEVLKLREALAADDSLRLRVGALEQEARLAAEEAARWEALDRELGGENGARFRLYAQGITLAQLIEQGNVYLLPMTNGRYEMLWDAEGADARRLLPTVVDRRAGGERRPVVNLSGGERFQVSLALALGLSRLNAGSLQVETLFLDEGFGTLDEKTLDISIATLEGIQREGDKTIGIISHVRELESRLRTKVLATKRGDGRSELSGPGVSVGLAAQVPHVRRHA